MGATPAFEGTAAAPAPEPGPAPDALADLAPVHLVGVGGAGMSGLARILLERGVAVSGSDGADSPTLEQLRDLGATVWRGHRADQVAGARCVVVSSAIRQDNPELLAARERGIPVLHRSGLLARLMAGRTVLAVAGTHGKTTTTSMLAAVLRGVGLDPSFAIGGDVVALGGNAHHGADPVFVAEADESDGSFLAYRPDVAVVTNVEPDHLDHYGTAAAVETAFRAFVERLAPAGLLVACLDDAGAAALVADVHEAVLARGGRVHGYGTAEVAAVDVPYTRIADLTAADGGSRFRLLGAGAPVSVELAVPGAHNARNATAALLAAEAASGVPLDRAVAALVGFAGARRRFEHVGQVAGVRVFDDYAHHPTEVTALLRAARPVAAGGRLVVVFQPHLFSRTRIFARDFGAALGLADEVVVADVYPAREDPVPGVTGELVATAVPAPTRSRFVPDLDAIPALVASMAAPGDVVLTVGAGSVTRLGPQILECLRRERT